MNLKSKAQWDKMLASTIKAWRKGLKCDDSHGRRSYRVFMAKIQEDDPLCNFMEKHFEYISAFEYKKKCGLCPMFSVMEHECCEEYYKFADSDTYPQFLAALPPMIARLESLKYKDYVEKVREYKEEER